MKRVLLVLLLCYPATNANEVKNAIICKNITGNSYDKIDTVNITAAQEYTIYGILLDADNNIISDSVINNSIKWEICRGNASNINFSKKFGNTTTVVSNYAYSEYLITLSYNNTCLDSLIIFINPAPSYKICVDTSTTTAHTINQLYMQSDSIDLFLYLADCYNNFVAHITDCNWTVLDSTQISVEKSTEIISKYVIKAKKDSINTDLIFKIDTLFSDTIHIFSFSSSILPFKQGRISTNRHHKVATYDLLGKKVINSKSNKIGCRLIRFDYKDEQPHSEILLKVTSQ